MLKTFQNDMHDILRGLVALNQSKENLFASPFMPCVIFRLSESLS